MKLNSFSMPTAQELEQLISFCKVMAGSPFYQKLGAGGVLAIFLTAKEYDLPFMACLNGGLHTFDGKVTFSAIMIDALILKAGHKTEVLRLDDEACTIRFTRGDRKNDKEYKGFTFTYTIEQARKAGYLSKKNWQTSLRDMLYSRCMTGGGRKHIPEVFVGVLVSGELVGDDSDGNIEPILPPHVKTNLLPTPTESVANIEYQAEAKVPVPAEGFEEFIERFQLKMNDKGQPASRHMEYVLVTMDKTKMHLTQIINSAIKNEKIFEERFNKWSKDNIEKISE